MSIVNRLTGNGHLDERALTAAWSAAPGDDVRDPHLAGCAACRARLAALSTWLEDLRTEAVAEADEAFPAERLAAQQAQILRRIQVSERPARIIAFPRGTAPATASGTPVRRWIAGAAAAGLIAGVALGNYMDLRHALDPRPGSGIDAPQVVATRPGALQPVSATLSDEELLWYMDADAPRIPDSLVAYDSMTPRARDYPR